MRGPARSRAWIAIAVAAAAIASSPRAPRAEPAPPRPAACPPAARLAGDAELAGRVGLELAVLGVFSQDIPAGCPSVRVTVRADGEAVVVSLRDPSGRAATQVVTNAHVAATWIESWVHPELGAALLAGREPARAIGGPATAAFPRQVEPAGGIGRAAGDAGVSVDELGRAVPGPLTFRGLFVGASAEKVYASDDSEWRGVGLSACARLGPLCPGLLLHVGDSRGFVAEGAWSSVDRVGVDLLASLSAPFAVGRMEVVPGIGVGMGALRTSGAACDANAAGETLPCEVAGAATWTLGPRAEMGIAGTFPISDRVSLLVTASLAFAPTAPRGTLPDDVPVAPSPGDPNPDGSIPDPSDPDDAGGTGGDTPGDDGQPIDPLTPPVPGEPRQLTRIGIGLSVSLP